MQVWSGGVSRIRFARGALDVARERTLVTIAHRLDTVRRADHVVVLERGRVVDEGPLGAVLAGYREGLEKVFGGRSPHSAPALRHVASTSAQFCEGSEIPRPTAQRFIALLRHAGLWHTVRARRGRSGGVVAFTELIEIIEGRSPG
jgi:ABC-type glutathione transport system ATPase component